MSQRAQTSSSDFQKIFDRLEAIEKCYAEADESNKEAVMVLTSRMNLSEEEQQNAMKAFQKEIQTLAGKMDTVEQGK